MRPLAVGLVCSSNAPPLTSGAVTIAGSDARRLMAASPPAVSLSDRARTRRGCGCEWLSVADLGAVTEPPPPPTRRPGAASAGTCQPVTMHQALCPLSLSGARAAGCTHGRPLVVPPDQAQARTPACQIREVGPDLRARVPRQLRVGGASHSARRTWHSHRRGASKQAP
jgi:hypothetical protein